MKDMTYNENACRFGLVVKKDFIENRRSILGALGGYFAVLALTGMWFGYFQWNTATSEILVYCMICSLMLSIASSPNFSNMKDKQGRLSYLMMPATAAEKFWPRILGATVGLWITAVAGYFLFSVCATLVDGLTKGSWSWIEGWKFIFSFGGKDCIYGFVILISGILFNQSAYILGSALWPKYSFLKTLLALSALQIVGSIVLITGVTHWGTAWLLHINEDLLLWGLAGVNLLICAAMIWGSYTKMRNYQIIGR